MRAGAGGFRFCGPGCGLTGQLTGCVENNVNLGIGHPIINIPAITPVLNQLGFTQNGQLLRDVSLPETKEGFHVADAMLAISQQIEDGDARGVGQGFKHLNLGVQWFEGWGSAINHIQSHEYDYSVKLTWFKW